MEYKKEKEEDEPQFDITDRGYNAKAFYLAEPKGEALIQITKDGEMLREFLFPAYKIWNIAAHFKDIVDGEVYANNMAATLDIPSVPDGRRDKQQRIIVVSPTSK